MSTSNTDLHQLHINIIEYLTNRSRVMSCQKLETWNEFTAHYNFQYSDYSNEDLRREFLETILPKVFTYDLTPIQRRKVEIFATYNTFSRTEQGFLENPRDVSRPKEGFHFARSNEDAKLHRISCIIEESSESREIPTSDQKIHAWTSAVNSTDDEIAFNRLHNVETLRSRVNQSREQFKETGDLPPNLQSTIAKKIVAYRNECQELCSRILND